MTTKLKTPSRLSQEILEIADDMRANDTMDAASFDKITMRILNRDNSVPVVEPLTGEDIRALREQAHMSQAVFAKYLNLTVGYVSQLERGAKHPTGAALTLLNIIRRKGIEIIL